MRSYHSPASPARQPTRRRRIGIRHPGATAGAGDPIFRQRGWRVAEAEYSDDAVVQPQFEAHVVIAEPEIATGREVDELVSSFVDRIHYLVASSQDAAARSAGSL